MKYLLICSCGGQEKKSVEAFKLLLPGEPTPTVVKGRDRIAKLSRELGNDHIKALSRLSGRFAYYVDIEDGKVVREYNLITGARTA